jgi:hypothetical protein
MNDTSYEVYQDGQGYRLRIGRLGHFIQEAEGFLSKADEAGARQWCASAPTDPLEQVQGSPDRNRSVPVLRGQWMHLVQQQ